MADQTNDTATKVANTNGGESRPITARGFAAVMSQKLARQVTQVGLEGVAPGTLQSRQLLLAWRRLNAIDEQLFTRQAWVAGANQDYAAHAQQMGEVLKQIEKIIEFGLKVLGRSARKQGSIQTTQPAKGVTLQ